MHHVGLAYHTSPHIIVLFTCVPETLCIDSLLQFYEPCSALGAFPLIMLFLSFEFITAR
jgi:hypothetical protein